MESVRRLVIIPISECLHSFDFPLRRSELAKGPTTTRSPGTYINRPEISDKSSVVGISALYTLTGLSLKQFDTRHSCEGEKYAHNYFRCVILLDRSGM